MKSVTVTVTVSAQWRERPWGRWPHRELIPQICSIKERSVFPEGRKVSRALDVSERVEKWMYVCFGRRWLTYTGVFPSLRWGESDCWLTPISLFFLFFSSLWEGWRQTEGSLGIEASDDDSCYWDYGRCPVLICLISSQLGCACVCVYRGRNVRWGPLFMTYPHHQLVYGTERVYPWVNV